jgi:hypothetical protein
MPAAGAQRWSWDQDAPKPVIEASGETSARIEHPFLGTIELLAGTAPDGTTPELLFCENETSEYFHGDNGAGLGASHQTGWTGVIADLIRRRHGEVPSVGDVLRDPGKPGRAITPLARGSDPPEPPGAPPASPSPFTAPGRQAGRPHRACQPGSDPRWRFASLV